MNKYDSVIRISKINIVTHFSSQMARTLFQISILSHCSSRPMYECVFVASTASVLTLEVITCGLNRT
jgi:hypothetical protein